MSRILARLERQEYVARRTHRATAAATRCHLTDAGRAALMEAGDPAIAEDLTRARPGPPSRSATPAGSSCADGSRRARPRTTPASRVTRSRRPARGRRRPPGGGAGRCLSPMGLAVVELDRPPTWTTTRPGTSSGRCTPRVAAGDAAGHRAPGRARERVHGRPAHRDVGPPVDGTPVVDVDRGGRITWHGPGQLVAYPIVRLRRAGRRRRLRAGARAGRDGRVRRLGVTTIRVEGRSGVWCRGRRRSAPSARSRAIGVRVARGVTMHGLALNCEPGPDRVRADRAVRDRRRRRHVADRRAGPRVTVAEVEPLLRDYLDGARWPRSGAADPPAAARAPHVGWPGDCRPRGPPHAAGRGPQRRDPDREEARVDQDPGDHGARSTPSSRGWSDARACTRCARRPAAPTSSSAGRTARRRSSSAATSAPAAATSARSTPASRPPSTATSRAGSPSRSQAMGLRYSTVTGVARDDLPDGGAWLYAETVRQIHALNPGTGVELLIPDFNARPASARRGVRLPARGARAQPRDGAADLQADPPRLPLRAVALGAHRGPRRRPGHQVQPHPRHG